MSIYFIKFCYHDNIFVIYEHVLPWSSSKSAFQPGTVAISLHILYPEYGSFSFFILIAPGFSLFTRWFYVFIVSVFSFINVFMITFKIVFQEFFSARNNLNIRFRSKSHFASLHIRHKMAFGSRILKTSGSVSHKFPLSGFPPWLPCLRRMMFPHNPPKYPQYRTMRQLPQKRPCLLPPPQNPPPRSHSAA